MILTVLVLIFAIRIRNPLNSFFENTKIQKQKCDLTFIISFILMFGIVFVFKDGKYHYISILLPVLLYLFLSFVFYFQNLKTLSLEIEELLLKNVLDLRNGKSFYSSVKEFLSRSEAFKQQKYRNLLQSVLFAQQKPPLSLSSDVFCEYLNLVRTVQESSHRSRVIVEIFRENLLRKKNLARKKLSISQNIRSQVLVCSFLFASLCIFQLNTAELSLLLPYLVFSATFFVIGLLGIISFMRFYI